MLRSWRSKGEFAPYSLRYCPQVLELLIWGIAIHSSNTEANILLVYEGVVEKKDATPGSRFYQNLLCISIYFCSTAIITAVTCLVPDLRIVAQLIILRMFMTSKSINQCL